MKSTYKLPAFILTVLLKDKGTPRGGNPYQTGYFHNITDGAYYKPHVAPFLLAGVSNSQPKAILYLLLVKKVGNMLHKTLFGCYLGGSQRYCPSCCHAERFHEQPTFTRGLAPTRLECMRARASQRAGRHGRLPSKPLRESPDRPVT